MDDFGIYRETDIMGIYLVYHTSQHNFPATTDNRWEAGLCYETSFPEMKSLWILSMQF